MRLESAAGPDAALARSMQRLGARRHVQRGGHECASRNTSLRGLDVGEGDRRGVSAFARLVRVHRTSSFRFTRGLKLLQPPGAQFVVLSTDAPQHKRFHACDPMGQQWPLHPPYPGAE
eukprot:scaffold1927_cov333-Pavlova_lutheri.AAC.11